jgi:hypothetical protein
MEQQCLICFECFQPDQIDKVACDSSVDHCVCFGCERIWRSKMKPKRIMDCPACRQPERYRTTASLLRESEFESPHPFVSSAIARATPMTIIDAILELRPLVSPRMISQEELDVINARLMGRPRPTAVAETEFERILQRNARAAAERAGAPTMVRPRRAQCASGRDCRSTSQSGRATTHLKCIHCSIVFCCRNCNECVGCRP